MNHHSPSGPKLVDLARWLTRSSKIVRAANRRWVEYCRERGLGTPGGIDLVDRASLHSGVRRRLPLHLRAIGTGRSDAQACAVAWDRDPVATRLAVRTFLADVLEERASARGGR